MNICCEIPKDLYNVRVEVNGKSHIYRYAAVRYNGDNVDEDSLKSKKNHQYTLLLFYYSTCLLKISCLTFSRSLKVFSPLSISFII